MENPPGGPEQRGGAPVRWSRDRGSARDLRVLLPEGSSPVRAETGLAPGRFRS